MKNNTQPETVTTYKGFDKDLTCRGFQFEVGETYKHKGKVDVCSTGFHSCEYPLDCFRYYPPAESRYAETVSEGEISREDGGDSKIASDTITIKNEITMHQMATRAIEWTWDKVDSSLMQSNTGYQSAASNTGYRSAASNTGYQSAASNTGNQSAASNTGNQSAAEVSGSHSVAAAFGLESKARACENSAIVLCYRDADGELIHIRASKVGDNGIKPNIWYTLNESGQFVEAEE